MPPLRLADLPRDAKLWVQATLLTSAMGGAVACGASSSYEGDPPTCGPCCHGPQGAECQSYEQQAQQPTGPTAGDESGQGELDAGVPEAPMGDADASPSAP